MVHILGKVLPDGQLARHALTHFYGIGRHISHRLCARMQIHDRCRVRDLTSQQILHLTAFLASPSTAPSPPNYALASPSFIAPRPGKNPLPTHKARAVEAETQTQAQAQAQANTKSSDPLKNLKIETELKKEIRENIMHQRMIGSYVGRRHALSLPVRGQGTRSNAKTAKKLNRIGRYN